MFKRSFLINIFIIDVECNQYNGIVYQLNDTKACIGLRSFPLIVRGIDAFPREFPHMVNKTSAYGELSERN